METPYIPVTKSYLSNNLKETGGRISATLLTLLPLKKNMPRRNIISQQQFFLMPKDYNKNALAFGSKHDRVLKKGGHVFQKLHQLS